MGGGSNGTSEDKQYQHYILNVRYVSQTLGSDQ